MSPSKRRVDTFEFADQETAQRAEAELNKLYPASAQLLVGAQVLVITEADEIAHATYLALSLGGKGWTKKELNG